MFLVSGLTPCRMNQITYITPKVLEIAEVLQIKLEDLDYSGMYGSDLEENKEDTTLQEPLTKEGILAPVLISSQRTKDPGDKTNGEIKSEATKPYKEGQITVQDNRKVSTSKYEGEYLFPVSRTAEDAVVVQNLVSTNVRSGNRRVDLQSSLNAGLISISVNKDQPRTEKGDVCKKRNGLGICYCTACTTLKKNLHTISPYANSRIKINPKSIPINRNIINHDYNRTSNVSPWISERLKLTLINSPYSRRQVNKQTKKEKPKSPERKAIEFKSESTEAQHHVTCKECPEKFDNSGSLKKHMSLNHYKHNCNKCGKAMPSKSALSLHIPIHDEVRPFSCDVCGHGFNQKGNLKAHKEKNEKCQTSVASTRSG